MVKLHEAPEGKSWADVVFGEVPKAKHTFKAKKNGAKVFVPPSYRFKSERSRSRSPGAAAAPKNGDLRNAPGGAFEVYKKGKWVETEVHNAAGEYGGPYADARELQKNPKYQAEMKDIYGAEGNSWEDVVKKMAAARRAEKVASKTAAAKGGARRSSTRRRRATKRRARS